MSFIGAAGWHHPAAIHSDLHPEIGFFGIDSGNTIPLPKQKVNKPEGARSEFLNDAMSSDQYLQLCREEVAAGHSEDKTVLLYYWGEGGASALGPGQGHCLSGSNLATWSSVQLRQLRAMGLKPFIALESFKSEDIYSMIKHLSEGGYSGQEIIVRLTAEPGGSCYTPTPEEYRERFESASRLMKSLGSASGITIKLAFTVCGIDDFRFTPSRDSFSYIGMDLFVTPANKNEVMNFVAVVGNMYPDKALVVPECGIATRGERGKIRATPAWADQATHEVLTTIKTAFPGRVKSLTPYDLNAMDRVKDRSWSWVWTPEMHAQLVSFTHA